MVHSSICWSPSELPKAAIGRRPICESIPTWINGSSVGRGDLQLCYEGSDLLYRAGPGGHWAGLTVTRETLQSEARKRLGRELPLTSSGMEHLRVDGRAFDRLANVIDSLRPGSNRILRSRSVEAAGELLLGTYVEVIGSADPSFSRILRQRVAYRHEVVRRADAAMRSLIGKGYSSAQFCRSLGMSDRNLELYFHQSLGLSPKAWFQCLSCTRLA